MDLRGWQETALRRVLDGSSNVMVVAEQQAGKTTLLNHIRRRTGAPVIDGLTADGEDVIEAVEAADSLVLMDEGGAFRYYRQLTEALEENPDVQFVVVTLPDCPSMGMVRGHFEVVRASEYGEDSDTSNLA